MDVQSAAYRSGTVKLRTEESPNFLHENRLRRCLLNMKTKTASLGALAMVTLVALTAAAISLAQSSSQSPTSASNPSLNQTEYYNRLRSGTLAGNLSDAE